MVIEDRHGIERIRIHTPRENTTVQLGSIEEPEEGALTRTDAHISQASRLSHNEATRSKVTMAEHATTLLGDSAFLLAGIDGLRAACERGIEEPGAVHVGDVLADLGRLAKPPQEEEDEDDEAAASDESEGSGGDGASEGSGGGGMWSALGSALSQSAESTMMDALRAMAEASDDGLARANGREQGQPLGQPVKPGAFIGSPLTSALFSRDRAMVYGDRVAALSSHDTASVMGEQMTELKSPTKVEVAAGERIDVSTPGVLDLAAGTIRAVAGYYPEYEPPPLGEGTSIGVMAREDIKVMSIEHCILVCAHKNLIASAHTGDMRLTAENTVAIKGAKITGEADQVIVSAGGVSVGAGTITMEASGDVTIKAGGTITLEAPDVIVDGNLTVTGTTTLEGKLTELDSVEVA